jgi:aconitate decarboxylase
MDTKPDGALVTPQLGQWISELTISSIPGDILSHLKLCLLDSIGCGLFGAIQRCGRITGDVAATFSPGGMASLFARVEKVSPADAALANGTAIHGFEIDDAHITSSLHPGAVTLPASLAVAEARQASGADLLTALATGYEVGLRVGICAGVSHSTSGYHVTGTAGALGAAAAAARLLKLSPLRAAHALGIGATQAAGLYAARTGGMAKRFHAGRASQSGVVAAYLAERGFTGTLDALEASFGGFMSTLRGQHDPTTMLAHLGERWETARVGLKAYAACASAHTTIDGVLELRRRGLSPDNLDRLTVRMSRKGHLNIGWPYQGGNVTAAQMNGSYSAAVTLLDGAAFIDQYDETRLADPRILALISRIDFRHDPELDRGGAAMRHAVLIDAVLKDGCRLSTTVEQRRGSADYPLSRDEVKTKFARTAAVVLPPSAIDELVELVEKIDRQADLSRLAALVTTAG